MLHRLGFDASLTLGNKKSVDISVVFGPGHAITIDVKAVAGKMDWLMGTPVVSAQPQHFVILVSYEGQFGNHEIAPRCWVLRHQEVLPLIKAAGARGAMRYLSRKQILDVFSKHEGAWHRLAQ